MRAVWYCPVLLLTLTLLPTYSEALSCYSCMASNNDDCNRQGSKTCHSFSDACAVVVGHDGGMMKSCSYRSFCSQSRTPGVHLHCCYSDDCNVAGLASKLPTLSYLLLLMPPVLHWIF